jgi:GlpG protein
MLNWFPVICFPLATNLQPLLNHLASLNVRCRVTEEIAEGQNKSSAEQQIWTDEQEHVLYVAELCSQWAAGELQVNEARQPVPTKVSHSKFTVGLHLAKRLPVTISMILLGLIGAALINADSQQLIFAEPFLFQGITNNYFVPLSESWDEGEYWRLITPIFLHFSFLHILFNSLILWEVGRRIEIAKGPFHYLGFILLAGVVSNISQYTIMNNTIFGGLSGVVYGVIGYIAVYQEFIKHPILQFNKATIAFFLVWLLLGVFGVIDVFIQGSIANAAHVSGLLVGAIFGGVMVFIDKLSSKDDLHR